MASYADVAASGPSQSAEEARAPPPPEVLSTEDSTSSLIDVDTPHVSTVPSDWETQSIKTDTQAERLEREEKAAAARAEADAKAAAKEAKRKARKTQHALFANADNPVVLGNLVATGVVGVVLGIGAYRKYTAGELTWKVAGLWAGAVGAFAAADYFVTSRLFKKYPPKN